jgi:acetyl-CoA acetyltransferase
VTAHFPLPAITGLGMTRMSLTPSGTALEFAHEAISAALDDAGQTRREVDGLLVNSSQGIRPDRLGVSLARRGGFGDLALLEHLEIKGATAAAMVQHAFSAVRGGLARTVVCVFGDAPLQPGGTSGSLYAHSGGSEGVRGLERASGVLGSVPTYAMLASRYFTAAGASDEDAAEDLCAVACATRQWAQRNPHAVVRKPLTREDYLASRMVSTPLRLLDCARPVNGSVALVISDVRSGGPGSSVPVFLRGSAQWHPMRRRRTPDESWYGDGVVAGGTSAALDRALAMAARARDDIDVLQLYDPFSVVTLALLEGYGFCAAAQAGKLVRAGETAPGGSMPTNTGGGQLSGFYLQGMTPLAEAVIQVRGAGGERQVPNASTALVAGIGGRIDHHSFLVLDREAG